MSRRKQKVSVHIRIRKPDGGQPYCPAVWQNKKALKPHWCFVDKMPEYHPEGTYYLRYRINGKQIWEYTGDNPDTAKGLRIDRQGQLANPNLAASQRLAEHYKPESKPEEDRYTLANETERIWAIAKS